jgi:hypothetical protein
MLYDQDDDDFSLSEEQFQIFKKILSIFNNHFDTDLDEILQFTHNVSSTNEEKFVTIHPSKDGDIVLSVLTPEQLDMVLSICEFSNRSIEHVIPELAEEGDIPTISVNPKEF